MIPLLVAAVILSALNLAATAIKGRTIMGQLEDIADKLDKATNLLAARLQQDAADLAAAKAAGLPPDPATIARISATADSLLSMGANASNPVPAIPAEIPPPVATP